MASSLVPVLWSWDALVGSGVSLWKAQSSWAPWVQGQEMLMQAAKDAVGLELLVCQDAQMTTLDEPKGKSRG